jgi:SAM-dependent methyltransferase
LLRSQLCRSDSLLSPELLAWAQELRPAWEFAAAPGSPVLVNRKVWEWLFAARALEERGMLRPGRRGLVFGVGREPLAAAFAARGCEIVATDLDPVLAAARGWVETAQHAATVPDLDEHGLCDPATLAARVTLRTVDMTDIPSDLRDFDFLWSLCAFEHLGSLGTGARFVLESLRCLRPGGLAVHTTEFNLSSDDDTLTDGPTVIYRRHDIDALVGALRLAGHRHDDVDYDAGDAPADRHVDEPPYGEPHLRLRWEGHVVTSLALVITRATRTSAVAAAARRSLRRLARRPQDI